MLQVNGSTYEYSKIFVSNPDPIKIPSVQCRSSTTVIIDGIYLELQSAKLSVLIEVIDLILTIFA